MPWPGIGVTGDDERAVDRVRAQEAVDDLQRGEHSAGAVGDVEGERAVGVGVGILGVGADVVLDERGERGLAEVPVAVDARIDQQIQVVGLASGPLAGRPWPPRPPGAARCAGHATGVRDVDAVNDCAHSGPPNPRRG